MAQGDTPITIVGNLTTDPELRFTNSGTPVATFRVASTPRVYNRDTSQWEDGEALFITCNAWKQMGENIAETLTKGTRVIVTGNLKQRTYEAKDGTERTVVEIEVYEVGPSLRYATVQVERSARDGNTTSKNGKEPQATGSARPSDWGADDNRGGFNKQETTTTAPWS